MAFVSSIRYELGAEEVDINDLAAPREQLDQLSDGGLRSCRVHSGSSLDLAASAASQTLDAWGRDRGDLDLVILASSWLRGPLGDAFSISTWMNSLGIDRVVPYGMTLGWCAGAHVALRAGRAFVDSHTTQNVLVVVVEQGDDRILEPTMSINSDAAVAAVISASEGEFEVLSSEIRSNGVISRTDRQSDFVSYVAPIAALVEDIGKSALAVARIGKQDVDLVLTNNYTEVTMAGLRGFSGLDKAPTFTANAPIFGHALACDNLINLRDAQSAGLAEGNIALLGSGAFQFGMTVVRSAVASTGM